MSEDNTIVYEHYETPVATKKVLNSKSALAWGTKRNVAIEECVRRLQNCSPNLPWEVKAAFLSEYMGRLKQAGYNERFRVGVLNQALARFEGMVKADLEGKQPLYRDSTWWNDPANCRKQKKKKDWTQGSDGVIFVQSTPNGELAKKFRETIKKFPSSVKLKVVEKGGRTLKSTLVKTNPSRNIGCNTDNCLPCKNGQGQGGDCRKTNIGYELGCDNCAGVKSVVYYGESSQNAYVRGLKHQENFKYKIKSSPLFKHAQTDHQGDMNVKYSMKVKTKFADTLTRQVNEGVRISRSHNNLPQFL